MTHALLMALATGSCEGMPDRSPSPPTTRLELQAGAHLLLRRLSQRGPPAFPPPSRQVGEDVYIIATEDMASLPDETALDLCVACGKGHRCDGGRGGGAARAGCCGSGAAGAGWCGSGAAGAGWCKLALQEPGRCARWRSRRSPWRSRCFIDDVVD